MNEELFNWITIGWMFIAIIVIPLSLKLTAPYGRHTRKGWGTMIDNKLGWIIMELPALSMVWIVYSFGVIKDNQIVYCFLAFWSIHYVNRTLIYPFRIRTKGKKMPISIIAFAILFNLMNGGLIGYYFGNFASYTTEWLTDWRFLLGVTLFFIGMGINMYSDNVLINLRKPGETGYKIPYGGFFRYVSCPNLFGEMVEWLGFALMTWCLPTLSFFIWTVANLTPRALDHHKWYKEKFEDYPKERKAVFPFIL